MNTAATLAAGLGSSSFYHEDEPNETYDPAAAKRQHRATMDAQSPQSLTSPLAPAVTSAAPSTVASRRQSAFREQSRPLLGPRPLDYSSYNRTASDTQASHQSPTRRSLLPNGASEPFLGLSARRMGSNNNPAAPSYNASSSPAVKQALTSPKPASRVHGDLTFSNPARLDARSTLNASTAPVPAGLYPLNVSTTSTNSTLPNNGPTPKASPVRQRNPALRAAQLSTASANGSTTVTPLTIRTRRQSQFPPPAPTRADPLQPRQSVGPGLLVPVPANNPPARVTRNFLDTESVQNDSSIGRERPPQRLSTFANIPITQSTPSSTPRTNVAHVEKSSKVDPAYSSPGTTRSNFVAQRSDVSGDPILADGDDSSQTRSSASRVSAPTISAAKRPHLGLARAVSPTDVKKSKRTSGFHLPITTPTRSPTPEFNISTRKRSPTPPRPKQSPQSSYRNTPEIIQNAGAGRSVSSRSSFTSSHPPSSAVPNRPSATSQSSKQASPKLNPAEKLDLEGTERVPPVPAIPKAFESPNQSTEEPFFSASESLDTASKTDSIPSEPANANSRRASPTKPEPRARRRFTLGPKLDSTKVQAQQKAPLPPLNLLPLGNHTSDRIANLTQKKQTSVTDGRQTPPSKPNGPKTPTTPMTASRATFSNAELHKHFDPKSQPRLRSGTADRLHAREFSAFLNSNTSSPTTFLTPSPPPAPSNEPIPAVPPITHRNNPAVVNEQEFGSKIQPQPEARVSRISGRPSRAFSRSGKESNPPTPNSSQTENSTSFPSVRRKLSLGWRRSSSKASHSHVNDDSADTNPEMLPPKLPASYTFINESDSSRSAQHQTALSNNEPTIANDARLLSGLNHSDKAGKSKVVDHESNAVSQASKPDQRSLSTGERAVQSRSPMQRLLAKTSISSAKTNGLDGNLDGNDTAADEEMRKLASKKKDFETAAKSLERLREKASPKEPKSPEEAASVSNLNIFERGEVSDYPDVFFCGLRDAKKCVGDLASQLSNFGYDDERGDYHIVMGDHLAYRYEVVDLLGKGSFGQVVRCIDHKTGKLVAIKIIRNKKRFHQQALVEVGLLQRLRNWDPESKHSNIEITQSFYFRGHLCIATELLGMNLYELIKAHEFHGFSLRLIRRFTRQMLGSLCLLHNHKVIHCDLKPENILLCHPYQSEIKVIDFGSSCFENEKVYTYIQSRFYRSPEVILGMDYGMPIDMWSVGCILAELYTGYPIFPGENEQEQLACIMEVFGPPEKHLIEKSSRKKLFFDSLGKPRVTVSSKGKRRRPSSKTLQQSLKCEDEAFLDFIAQCLRWDPERRLKPDAAISHDFVTGNKTRARSAAGSGASSPAKRPVANVQTPAKPIRPLPEVPATVNKVAATTASKLSGSSPIKAAGPPRRHSAMIGVQAGVAVKRVVNGSGPGSTLPRSISGKPDLASAAAIASVQRQR